MTALADAFVDAVITRDFAEARSLLHDEIDFRAMTPRRIWEADGPSDVEAHLRNWVADPEEEVSRIEATEPGAVEDTLRVGWRVHVRNAEGLMTFEQQAYLREREVGSAGCA